MTLPVGSMHGSPNTTPRKRTCERLADGYGATDVPWPITPIKPAFFERPARTRLPNNCGEIRCARRQCPNQLGGNPLQPHFGRALNELGIEWIAPHSPQAKGRIERLFETLQDRLVKVLRLAGIDRLPGAIHFLDMRFF